MTIKAIDVSCYAVTRHTVLCAAPLIFNEVLRQIWGISPNAVHLSLNMGPVCDALTGSICIYDLSRVVHLEVGDECLLEILPLLDHRILGVITWKWTMPRLHCFTIYQAVLTREFEMPQYMKFLDTHRKYT
ncbi:hypothetical protein M405DRAFT_265005 [Rhizopogon salebrosus TDB-379]|nr:hypothetical protein M405DRAFT_265005 [Rhizopogon salebrosus TDB-379]